MGQITVLGQRNLIQHLDGGVVEKILVKEGDRVQAGQLLVKLDDRSAKLALQLLEQQHRQLLHRAGHAAGRARRPGRPSPGRPELLAAAARDPATARSLATNQMLLANRRASREAQKAVLREQNARLQAQIAGLVGQKQGLAEQARLIKLEADSLTQLYEKGLTTRTRILALQRNGADLQGSIGTTEAQIQQNRVQMGENNLRMIGLDAEMQEENAKRLTELQTQLFELGDRISSQAAGPRAHRHHLAQPRRGAQPRGQLGRHGRPSGRADRRGRARQPADGHRPGQAAGHRAGEGRLQGRGPDELAERPDHAAAPRQGGLRLGRRPDRREGRA